MARTKLNYTVTQEGRDLGKTFVITEMSAFKGESWAMRAILAMIKSGVQLPDGYENLGMAGVAEIGLKALAGVDMQTLEPLLAEMLECVTFVPDTSKPHVTRKLFVDSDIEEILTLITLRTEVFKLHTGFLKAAIKSS